MYVVKTNELAAQFYSTNGLEKLVQMLTNECIGDHQVAYNVLCALWIMSYQEEARREFEDVNKSIIENSQKILNFFQKDKIIRIVLMIMESLSTS